MAKYKFEGLEKKKGGLGIACTLRIMCAKEFYRINMY